MRRSSSALPEALERLQGRQEEVFAGSRADELGPDRKLDYSGRLMERILGPGIVLAYDRVDTVGWDILRRRSVRLSRSGEATVWEVRIVCPAPLDELELPIKVGHDAQEVQATYSTVVGRRICRQQWTEWRSPSEHPVATRILLRRRLRFVSGIHLPNMGEAGHVEAVHIARIGERVVPVARPRIDRRVQFKRRAAGPSTDELGAHRVAGQRRTRPGDTAGHQLSKLEHLLAKAPVNQEAAIGPEVADRHCRPRLIGEPQDELTGSYGGRFPRCGRLVVSVDDGLAPSIPEAKVLIPPRKHAARFLILDLAAALRDSFSERLEHSVEVIDIVCGYNQNHVHSFIGPKGVQPCGWLVTGSGVTNLSRTCGHPASEGIEALSRRHLRT